MNNNQRKETFLEVKQRITRDEFVSKLTELGREDTIKFFELGLTNFGSLVHFYECENILEDWKQKKRKEVYEKKAKEKFEDLCFSVPYELLKKYYIDENHSLKETYEHFNITEGQSLQLIKHYELKKPKSLSKVHCEKTKLDKYGSSTYNNREQAEQTCLEKYGVPNPSQVHEFMRVANQTKIDKYGLTNSNNWVKGQETRVENFGSLEESYKVTTEHRQQTLASLYGEHIKSTSQLEWVKEKIKTSTEKTFTEKYGANCYWTTENAKRSTGSKQSSYNVAFEKLLIENNITYEREVTLGNFIYDFKINDYLVEINPAATHNITWSPFSDKGIDKYYHKKKSDNARKYGLRCIHIWEWDDCNKIIKQLFIPKTRIYARNCVVKLVDLQETKVFIDNNHLQGYARDTIRVGLYYNNELVSIMTFGKPRFNLMADYELIRYCSSHTVIGGAEKLFKYFLKTYQPKYVVSYCDTSKFAGDIYKKLGFEYRTETLSHHWFNFKTNQHILDSLLRKRGFDQLFNTQYGKGTSNTDLMVQHGFVEVVDSGQATYMYKNSSIKESQS